MFYFLAVKQALKTINSLEELANQSETKYGVLDNGSVQKFFQTSEDPLYMRMFSHMREFKTFVDATSEGVKKARSENYAYITEQPYLEYYNQQKPCNTRILNNLLQVKSYGIGLQKNSPYTNRISVAILEVSDLFCCCTSSVKQLGLSSRLRFRPRRAFFSHGHEVSDVFLCYGIDITFSASTYQSKLFDHFILLIRRRDFHYSNENR